MIGINGSSSIGNVPVDVGGMEDEGRGPVMPVPCICQGKEDVFLFESVDHTSYGKGGITVRCIGGEIRIVLFEIQFADVAGQSQCARRGQRLDTVCGTDGILNCCIDGFRLCMEK